MSVTVKVTIAFTLQYSSLVASISESDPPAPRPGAFCIGPGGNALFGAFDDSSETGRPTLQVADQTVDSTLLALGMVALVILVIAFVAVSRYAKADIAKVIETFSQWWPWRKE